MTEPLPFCQGPDWKPRRSTKEPGTCGACGTALVGRAHWFCPSPRGEAFFTQSDPAFGIEAHEGESCRSRYMRNHRWEEARAAAIRRDGSKCRRCGVAVSDHNHELEVNHIVPRNGQGYGIGCWNHLENLETLCHQHHLLTTAAQRGYTPGGRAASRRRERQERDLTKLAAWTHTTTA